MKPANENDLGRSEAERMKALLDALENLDDVQNVYTTAVLG
jgi:transcriptional/translational regulatory protein YebC/TACO1